MNTQLLTVLLMVAAAIQAGVALLNLSLERILGWKDDVERMPLLVREVFHIHAWFISLTLAIFAAMTLRFASDMASGADPAARWLAVAIGIFWSIRTVMQVGYYSPVHWRGKTGRTVIHAALLTAYAGMSAAYLCAAAGFGEKCGL